MELLNFDHMEVVFYKRKAGVCDSKQEGAFVNWKIKLFTSWVD